ncbi:alpha/beta hydrolase [Streptomyces sp. NPDC004031]
MSETTTGTALSRPAEPDWTTVTDAELRDYAAAENRFRAAPAARAMTGEPDPGALTGWQDVALPGRSLPVRVHRPAAPAPGPLPLILHVHGGGFVGTAVQCDWTGSHLAARLPALVVSVEHRLLASDTPLAHAVDDAWDVLRHILGDASWWGVDPARTAVFGESYGGLVSALVALRARDAGLPLAAQVLVNPALDVSATMLDHPSATEHARTPTLTTDLLRLVRRLATPRGADPRTLSPLHTADLGGLPPALLVIPTDDPLADHGRAYATRLRAAGTPARLNEHPGALHAFLTLPATFPQAYTARAEITGYLRTALAA